MSPEEYDQLDQESKEINKRPVLKAHVKELITVKLKNLFYLFFTYKGNRIE
jgi:hypothetical protein